MAKKTRGRTVGSRRQTAARGSAKRKSVARRPAATHGGADQALRVRMYRHGLGDCFLLTLPKKDGSPFYIMIDCGIVVGSGKPDIMRDVVTSIAEHTGGHVDILVVTHEHYDHVSGFAIAQDLFAETRTKGKLAVGQVWFGWTEDPSDALAKRLRRERQARVNKLAGLVAGMGAQGGGSPGMAELAGHIDNVLGFFGVQKGKAAAGGTGPAMEFARSLGRARYCRPADKPFELPDLKGIRVYVLGPPPEEKMLRKTDSKTEVYHLANLGAARSFFMTLPGAEREHLERYQPFEPPARYRLEALQKSVRASPDTSDPDLQFFTRHYFGGPKAPDQSWRRIDDAFMSAAAEFALQLDSATNNTSLVLVFELVDSGKVLLFAADAQVGNWLSWQDVQWKLDANTTVTGPDLLKRTVFYKVGHHGSHNATLRAKGLELMQSDDLVAFVPVNHKMAKAKGWGKMPLPKLMKELNTRTQGRVVRADEDYVPQTRQGKEFAKLLTKEKLFYEWTMPMS